MVFSMPHQFLSVALGHYLPSLYHSLFIFPIGRRQHPQQYLM